MWSGSIGAWGTAIFSDDTASDVRGDFSDLIAEGLSAEQATEKLLKDYQSSLDDPDDGPSFWLGLAVTQWNLGRLLEPVKMRALEIIDHGADLKRWSGDAKRRAVLEKTRTLLLSPPPPAKPLREPYREANDWPAGELISYQTPRGKYAVLRVVGHLNGSSGKHPIIELVDWYADEPASSDRARLLETRFGIERLEGGYQFSHVAVLAATSSRDQPKARLRRLGLSAGAFQRLDGCNTYRPWRHFGDYVDKVFAGPKQVQAGPGGQAHEPWQVGDILCHRTSDGRYLLFQVIRRFTLKPLFEGAPIVALLDWERGTLPNDDEMASLRAVLDHHKRGVHFTLVHDRETAAPESALERIGHGAVLSEAGMGRTGWLDMAVAQASEWLRLAALRRMLVEVLQQADAPMTTAAIWERVSQRGGRVRSAKPLQEIDAVLNRLRANAYPVERVGKDRWKWRVGDPAARRQTP